MNGSLKLEDKAFLIKLAEEVKARRMTTPAIFFLEMMRPLNFVGSQAMIFFGPIISAFVKTDGYYKAAEIFENHNSVEFLIREIERLDKNE
ncbi:MAG: hypothetical protein ACJ0RI_03005 [Candidatus Neomarinimicrobiota bacterium]|jgi:hypothetical protein|nr:hypothetical protein [Candidatus Neomarinimicrobiota bacterium]|tara:strand:+ start:306 stop:578 length:273 start_codon:yes stop_codon:yes gene_type:complete